MSKKTFSEPDGQVTNRLVKKISHAKVYLSESFAYVDVSKIINNPLQPRFHLDEKELDTLVASIKKHGLIQPITVLKKDDKFILEAGQRRWMAHKKLGLKTIKAIVHETSDESESPNEKSLFEIAIVENTQRENLDMLDLAVSFQNALDKQFYKSREALSRSVGMSAPYVGKVLKVLALDAEIINDLKSNKSINDVESLYEIQKISDKKEQVSVYFDFIEKKIDRKGLRELNRSKKKSLNLEGHYKLTGRAEKLKLEFSVKSLTDDEIEEVKTELEAILSKYSLTLFVR